MSHPQELSARVESWINDQGYPLEYATAHAFRKEGLHVQMGTHLRDPNDSDGDSSPREIDVRAWREIADVSDQHRLLMAVLCECKSSREKPWILLCNDVPIDFSASWRALPMEDWMRGSSPQWLESVAESFADNLHLAGGRVFAHNLVQAFTGRDSRDQAYASLMKIVWAARAFVARPFPAEMGTFSIAVPCVVVDAPLFEAKYDHSSGKIRVTPVSHGQILWTGGQRPTTVDVTSGQALADYAHLVAQSFDQVSKVLSQRGIEASRSS